MLLAEAGHGLGWQPSKYLAARACFGRGPGKKRFTGTPRRPA